ncbi:MAG: methylated-DNA--[protein]-cysteine S-methyltransferase [Candidatus Lokiarchaeota archaeon]|nr:methylated-DNA--[protein]-cysteine S-methyltransferase [Candidatus Lokiarchaeota archaeon]MBD3200416.1 methylated-DNA--[protein]-cysteine S-methyltransferase [Candidatus Lokiarchaeota archaeon]
MNNKYKNLKKRSNKQNSKVIGLISRFLNGEEIKFDLNILDFQNCSKFQKRVLIVESMIPRGKVNTYKLLAQNIGSPNASRAVGNALAKNPFPIIIPCHRVIKSNFQIGNYQGGSVMKRKLLESEGVQFKENDMVDPKHLWA